MQHLAQRPRRNLPFRPGATIREYAALEIAFWLFNKRLFGDCLPDFLITLQDCGETTGTFHNLDSRQCRRSENGRLSRDEKTSYHGSSVVNELRTGSRFHRMKTQNPSPILAGLVQTILAVTTRRDRG
jgi:hypothetical protein